MKLIIQIPCFNEEGTLGVTLDDLPRSVPGFETVEYLVIDDGSSDRTLQVAREKGVHHIVKLIENKGLARAFVSGLEECLRLGADVIVNTDADNQYKGACIADLVKPIITGETQIVVGERPISKINSFSMIKKILQRIGSWVVRFASGADIPDAPSGFRAYHRDAALQLRVNNNYTYTIETIIQAGRMGIPMTSVPIGVNEDLRPSRLFRSNSQYIMRSILTILRVFILYKPLKFFCIASFLPLVVGLLGISRFLWFYFLDGGSGHVQSLILSVALLILSFLLMSVGLIADLTAANRRLLEDIRTRIIRNNID